MPGGTGSIVERLEPADDAGRDPGLCEWPGRVPTLLPRADESYRLTEFVPDRLR